MNAETPQSLTLRQADDWHVHLRDGAMLGYVAKFTAEQFARAIIMPNLTEPVTTFAAADAYRSRIRAALGETSKFTPLMTCFLTDDIQAAEIEQGYKTGVFTAAKLYPLNATTNSSQGVTDIRLLHPVLEKMQALGMPLLVHGEVSDQRVDIFDREATFIEQILEPLAREFPALKIVLEHITTSDAVAFVEAAGPNVAATITPHHLMLDRNAMFVGGICPHHYCLPILKRDTHKLELRRAATSGSAKFFLGTDSAPHAAGDKEAACGCAGIFNAPFALECYAQVFEEEGALQHLEAFASENGPGFYGLPLNEGRVVLQRDQTPVPERLTGAGTELVPFKAGHTLAWRFAGRQD